MKFGGAASAGADKNPVAVPRASPDKERVGVRFMSIVS